MGQVGRRRSPPTPVTAGRRRSPSAGGPAGSDSGEAALFVGLERHRDLVADTGGACRGTAVGAGLGRRRGRRPIPWALRQRGRNRLKLEWPLAKSCPTKLAVTSVVYFMTPSSSYWRSVIRPTTNTGSPECTLPATPRASDRQHTTVTPYSPASIQVLVSRSSRRWFATTRKLAREIPSSPLVIRGSATTLPSTVTVDTSISCPPRCGRDPMSRPTDRFRLHRSADADPRRDGACG